MAVIVAFVAGMSFVIGLNDSNYCNFYITFQFQITFTVTYKIPLNLNVFYSKMSTFHEVFKTASLNEIYVIEYGMVRILMI